MEFLLTGVFRIVSYGRSYLPWSGVERSRETTSSRSLSEDRIPGTFRFVSPTRKSETRDIFRSSF